MKLLIVTGMSGSGKSSVMDVMEDIGFYCIDNIPPKLIPQFVDLCRKSETGIDKIAVAVDIRTGNMFAEIFYVWQTLKNERDVETKVLFIEANDEVIIQRYKETRRKHPLDEQFNGNIHEAIKYEREQLVKLKEIADHYIETTGYSTARLKEEVRSLFLENTSDSMTIKVMSFGFKYGVPTEADLIFDVRCLPNPFYIESLRNHTGTEECIQKYVMASDDSKQFFQKLTDLIDFLVPLYVKEGKSQLVISFGCTGGKHRSITFAELMAEHLVKQNYRIQKYHRDITKK